MAAYLVSAAAFRPPIAELAGALYLVRIFGLGRAFARYGERLVSHDVTFRLLGRLRSWLYCHLSVLSAGQLMHYRSADLLSRLMRDVDETQNLFQMLVAPVLVAVLSVGVVGVGLWRLDPALGATASSFLYAADTDPGSIRVRQLLDLTWEYPTTGRDAEPDVEMIVREINGVHTFDGSLVKDFNELKDDGSTACGCWIYSGIMPQPGHNLARNRQPDPAAGPGTHLNWGFSWPANRRMLYNRASADPQGRPWSEQKRYIWWDADKGQWSGPDIPDFPRTKRPDYEPDWSKDPRGLDAHSGRAPFIMMADGLSRLYVPSGLQDGPLPTHYEPVESVVRNAMYRQESNPMAKLWDRPENRYHMVEDAGYPYVITTYRLTEHHTGGTMSRSIAWLAEIQPQAFVELSPELATEKGAENGGWVTLWTARGVVEARVLVTSRMRPLRLDGRVVHVIGMPWHFGYMGIAQGDIANALSAMVGDPNVSIHEAKAFTCNLRAGRKDRE